jgi:hypothetical protein
MLAEVKVSVVERRSVDFYEEVGGPGDGCWDGAELEAETVVSYGEGFVARRRAYG